MTERYLTDEQAVLSQNLLDILKIRAPKTADAWKAMISIMAATIAGGAQSDADAENQARDIGEELLVVVKRGRAGVYEVVR